MPRKQDRPQREVEALRRFLSERARPESKRLAAAERDQAAVEQTRPVQRRLVSLFEPDQPAPASATTSPAPDGKPQPVTPSPAPRRTPRAWLLLAPAVTLAVGLAAGFALGSAQAGGEPPSAPPARSSATQPAPAPSTSVVVRPTASSACLETARRADQLIELLIRNRRGKAADLLVAYTVASRQCRRDASP
jgi:hypothetical protein